MPLADVRTGHVVECVRLLPSGLGVEVEVKGKPKLTADAVLITLPLGVMQSRSVRFEPELCPAKCKSFDRMGMGTENRVAMVFHNVFWPENTHFLRPVFGNYTFANLHALMGNNVLCAWVRPASIDLVEKMSDEETMADVEGVLRSLFPGGYEPPASYHVTRWKSDPYSRGAYSFVKVGATKSDYVTLAEPLTGFVDVDEDQLRPYSRAPRSKFGGDKRTRMYFAGEATILSDSYTVHGAYMSGRREAKKIAKWWENHAHAIVKERKRRGD